MSQESVSISCLVKDVIPYHQTSHGSQTLGFLNPSLVHIKDFLLLSQDGLTTAAMIISSLLSNEIQGESVTQLLPFYMSSPINF
jgi:hypothetical protein